MSGDTTRWKWGSPCMQLHPAHLESQQDGRPVLRPLKLWDAEPLLTESMPASVMRAQVLNQRIVIFASEGSKDVLVAVPLLGSEVSCMEDPSGEGQPFIMVSRVDEGEDLVWLFRVQDVHRLLEAMGASGAVRKDLVLSYDPTPLAHGGMATVHKATASFRGSIQGCVIKMFSELERPESGSRMYTEVVMASRVQSSAYFVRLHGLWSDDSGPRYGLLMECCSQGDVQSATMQTPYKEGAAMDVICDVLQGLSHLDWLGIIHRDIKPANILVRAGGQAVIADFGFACYATDMQAVCKRSGSPGYVAPEIITSRGASKKSDIFSAGCTLFFMLSGKIPFQRPGDDIRTLLGRAVVDTLNFSDPLFAFVSKDRKRFLKKLTKKSIHTRPSAAQALAMQCCLSSSEGSDQDEVGALKVPARPVLTEFSSSESLPSIRELPQVPRTFSYACVQADSDSDEGDMLQAAPRSVTVSDKPQTSRRRGSRRCSTYA